jgi:ATP-binding cassette subfamily F protein uup
VRQRPVVAPVKAPAPEKRAAAAPPPPKEPKKRKLSFKERAELDALPDAIDTRERERESVYASLADPALLRDGNAVVEAQGRLATLSAEIESLIARWEELETIAAS